MALLRKAGSGIRYPGRRVLRRPTAIALPDGTEELTGVRFYVDDARGFAATARERLADREPARR